MAIKWTPDLAVGVSEIDNQHKELFIQVDHLLSAMSQGKGKDEVEKIIKFLGQYVVDHFGMEEKLMIQHGYPGYASHKAQHTAFINDFSNLKKEFEEKTIKTFSVIQIHHRVVDWLAQHIAKTDKVLGEYLQTKK